jgi:hypothetical protein
MIIFTSRYTPTQNYEHSRTKRVKIMPENKKPQSLGRGFLFSYCVITGIMSFIK